jgi:hypothetical protein
MLWSNIPPSACESRPHAQAMCILNNKVGENYYAQRKKICGREELNPRPRLWYHAR